MSEVWRQDFELGVHDFDRVNIGSGNNLLVVAENPYGGTYALRIDQGGVNGVVYGEKTLPATKAIRIMLPVFLPSTLNQTGVINLLRAYSKGTDVIRVHIWPDGSWALTFNIAGQSVSTPQ